MRFAHYSEAEAQPHVAAGFVAGRSTFGQLSRNAKDQSLFFVPQFVLTVMYGSGRVVKKDSFCFRVFLSTQTE